MTNKNDFISEIILPLLALIVIVGMLFGGISLLDSLVGKLEMRQRENISDFPICEVVEKNTSVFGGYTLSMKCEEGEDIVMVPESIWMNISIGDKFDRLNVRPYSDNQ